MKCHCHRDVQENTVMDLLQGHKLVMKDCQSYKANYYLKKKKIIMYYFSASWVDDLALLEKLKNIYAENVKRKIGMEVVYVSSDKDEKQFSKYFRDHHGPWPSIAPCYFNLSELIRYTYNITCLPQIVVVRKEDGYIITRRGREQLEQNGINVLVMWQDYEADLTVVEESLIELHYPGVPKESVQHPAVPETAVRPDAANGEKADKPKEEDDDDDADPQGKIMSFSMKRSSRK